MTATKQWQPVTLPLRQIVAMITEWNTPWYKVMVLDIPGMSDLFARFDNSMPCEDFDSLNNDIHLLSMRYLTDHADELHVVSWDISDRPAFTSRATYTPIKEHVSA